jgi:hypothetical protein
MQWRALRSPTAKATRIIEFNVRLPGVAPRKACPAAHGAQRTAGLPLPV